MIDLEIGYIRCRLLLYYILLLLLLLLYNILPATYNNINDSNIIIEFEDILNHHTPMIWSIRDVYYSNIKRQYLLRI